ncbi:MAG TPA: TadG family pilus assembly protein, partial [Rhizomicrobium sp.]|nr:TadG family pilus assembly protein [Rhizomicrobium sp.]
LQGIADLAAMSAAANLNNAQSAANATAAANDWNQPIRASVLTGNYKPDAAVAADERFVVGAAPADAVRVTLSSQADLYFSAFLLGRSSVPISRTATAAQAQLASFSLGTRLASLNGGLANSMLSALTGSTINLSVADYNALANANVDLLQYSSALKTRAGISAASFNDTLSSNVSTGDALSSVADILSSQGNGSAANAMRTIASAANSQKISVGQLFDLGPYGAQDYVSGGGASGIGVSALDMATAVLQLAQAGRQVKLNLSLGVPGVLSNTAWLAIGQRPANSPWLAVTDANTVIVRTAQARLYLDLKVAPAGSALAGVASIDLPVYVELASAQAKLSSMTCGASPSANSVVLSVAPSIGQTNIGQINPATLDDFESEPDISPATLLSTLLLKVTGSSQVKLGGASWQSVAFTGGDISSGTIKTVKTNDAVQTSITSLLGKLSLNVQLLGLGLTLGQSAVTSAVQSSLSTVAAPLDAAIDNLTNLLGIGLGEADVKVNGVRCNNVALVQ